MAKVLGTVVAGLAVALLVTGLVMEVRGALDLALLGALRVHIRAGIVALIAFLLLTLIGGIGWAHVGFVVTALLVALATVPFLIFSAGYVPMESAVAAWLALLAALAWLFRVRQSRRSSPWLATAVAIGWPAALMALTSGFYLGVFNSLGTISNILNHVHLVSALTLVALAAATVRQWGGRLAGAPSFAHALALAIGIPVGLTVLGGRLLAAHAVTPAPRPVPQASLTIPSAGCGLPECHLESYQEWSVSAHRYSATNRAYVDALARLTARDGASATSSCARCHDPVRAALREHGALDDGESARLREEGVACVACHALDAASDPLGDGRFTLREPDVYLPDLAGSGALTHPLEIDLVYRWVKPHRANYMRPLRKKAELCAPCHQESAGGAHGLDTYATWQASGLASEGIGCRECHMHMFELDWAHPPWDHHTLGRSTSLQRLVPETSADDPDLARAADAARGWLDGTLRVRPSLLTYLRVMRDPQVRAYQRHYDGLPLLDVAIEGIERLRPGASADIAIRTGSRRLGHALPALVATSAETWLEVGVRDASGRSIFESGAARDSDELDTETRRLGPSRERPANPLDVWLASGAEAAGPGKRIEPGKILQERFVIAVPDDARPPFRVEARWRHRAMAPWLAREVLGAKAAPLPIDELARAEVEGPA